MAKGNDGNYLQHSIEVGVAVQLKKLCPQRALHLALAHGMAPFEPCSNLPKGQTHRLLDKALQAAREPWICGEATIVTAYRSTKASRQSYPNTGELVAAMIGRDRLFGGIKEVDMHKHAELVHRWRASGVMPVNTSWRREIHLGGALSCPPTRSAPWLFAADPMTFCRDGYIDDDKLYAADLIRLATALKAFIASGEPGVAAIFVYAVRPPVQQQFWKFADQLAAVPERLWFAAE